MGRVAIFDVFIFLFIYFIYFFFHFYVFDRKFDKGHSHLTKWNFDSVESW